MYGDEIALSRDFRSGGKVEKPYSFTELIETFMEFVPKLGEITDHSLKRYYLGEHLIEKESSLSGKMEVMAQYMKVLEEAETEAILLVEKEIIHLMEAIEKLKGEIRYLKHCIRFAKINISFRFRDRTIPKNDGTSSFPWLNTMNLSDLIGDF